MRHIRGTEFTGRRAGPLAFTVSPLHISPPQKNYSSHDCPFKAPFRAHRVCIDLIERACSLKGRHRQKVRRGCFFISTSYRQKYMSLRGFAQKNNNTLIISNTSNSQIKCLEWVMHGNISHFTQTCNQANIINRTAAPSLHILCLFSLSAGSELLSDTITAKAIGKKTHRLSSCWNCLTN